VISCGDASILSSQITTNFMLGMEVTSGLTAVKRRLADHAKHCLIGGRVKTTLAATLAE
jgi:hypothetical protein